MTQPDIQLSTAEIREHARMVDVAAEMCRDAHAAAQHIDLHDEVYGELCSPLITWSLHKLHHYALTTIHNRAQATADLADMLRMMADTVDAADHRAEQRHQETGSRRAGE